VVLSDRRSSSAGIFFGFSVHVPVAKVPCLFSDSCRRSSVPVCNACNSKLDISFFLWCHLPALMCFCPAQYAQHDAEDAGPDSELTFWRNRMAKFNSVAEQLKGKEARSVLGVVTTAKSKIFKRWCSPAQPAQT